MRVATKSRARGVTLLGIVVSATTFVALLAIIAILSATRLMEDLIRGSLGIQFVHRNKIRDVLQQLIFLVRLAQVGVDTQLHRVIAVLVGSA